MPTLTGTIYRERIHQTAVPSSEYVELRKKEREGGYIENFRSNIHGKPQWMSQDSGSIAEGNGNRSRRTCSDCISHRQWNTQYIKEFLITAEGIQSQNEEQRIAIPNQLLQQANIPEDADIQVICLDGVLVIACDSGMNQDELADVLDSLWSANDIITRLPPDPETAWEHLKNFTDDKGE